MAPLFENEKDNSSLKFDDKDKANILQKQFSSVFTREAVGKVPSIPDRTDSFILDMHVTEGMVMKKLKKLNANKSCGPDNIHARLLIELADLIAMPITVLFNMTMQLGLLSDDWKWARVTPIYKKGSKSHAVNYRPISLTSILCKLMESFVRDKVMMHIQELKLLTCKQFGFISGRSTVTQLLTYLDKCVKTIAEGGVIDTIYLDFAKAFDTAPHQRLTVKLQAYGIKGNILNWIINYLSGRS